MPQDRGSGIISEICDLVLLLFSIARFKVLLSHAIAFSSVGSAGSLQPIWKIQFRDGIKVFKLSLYNKIILNKALYVHSHLRLIMSYSDFPEIQRLRVWFWKSFIARIEDYTFSYDKKNVFRRSDWKSQNSWKTMTCVDVDYWGLSWLLLGIKSPWLSIHARGPVWV